MRDFYPIGHSMILFAEQLLPVIGKVMRWVIVVMGRAIAVMWWKADSEGSWGNGYGMIWIMGMGDWGSG